MKSRLAVVQRNCWYVLVALLPITSMPLVRKILGSDTIASPAILLLFFLVVVWILPELKDGLVFPKPNLVLWLFFCFAAMAIFFASFYLLPAYKGINPLRPSISALATLVIGLLFFFTASAFPVKTDVQKKTLQIINWSGLIVILWSMAQAIAWYGWNRYPQWMFELQGLISSRVLYRQRVTGLALEPSWLAHQLNLLYLPVWLSASLTAFSSHKRKFFFLTVENILLVGGVLTLGLTLSRVGYMAFACSSALALGLLHGGWVTKIQNRIPNIPTQKKNSQRRAISFMLFMVYVVILVVVVLVYSRFDPRMRSLFEFNFGQDNFLLRYFNELKFGDRVIYWISGWNIFNQYPLLGVGLGNAGFLIPDHIEPYGWSLVEVRRLIHRESFLLNIKSLWFRLLAETGIVGFSFFLGWLVSLVSGFVQKLKTGLKREQMLGLIGCFALLALIFEGFSIDSFAMPYWWISLGLASSAIDAENTLAMIENSKGLR